MRRWLNVNGSCAQAAEDLDECERLGFSDKFALHVSRGIAHRFLGNFEVARISFQEASECLADGNEVSGLLRRKGIVCGNDVSVTCFVLSCVCVFVRRSRTLT